MELLYDSLKKRLQQAQNPYQKLILKRCLVRLQEIKQDLEELEETDWQKKHELEKHSEKHSNQVIKTFLPYMLMYSLRLQEENS